MRRALQALNSDRGHVGQGIAVSLIIVGTVLLAIGIGNDTTGLSVAGVIVLGLGCLTGASAPHLWLRSIYRRLDKVDPEDHEAMPGNRRRIQF